MINLPPVEIRAADIPLLAFAIRRQDERALVCAHQHSYAAHVFPLSAENVGFSSPFGNEPRTYKTGPRYTCLFAKLTGMDIDKIIALVGRLEQTETRLAEVMTAGFKELRELHANTESKLNALIDTVDKLVRRNGHKE